MIKSNAYTIPPTSILHFCSNVDANCSWMYKKRDEGS